MTGDKRYLDAGMELFRVVRDKMRDGPFIGGGSYVRDFSERAAGGLFGGAARGTPGASPAGAPGRGAAAPAAGAPAGGAASAFANRRHGINLHMFEALLGLYEATRSPEVWKEIDAELTAIERLFDDKLGYLPESYDETGSRSVTRAPTRATCSSGRRCSAAPSNLVRTRSSSRSAAAISTSV